jgi:hypothetical protein
MSEFLDDYWWAVFLFLIFMVSVVFKPAPRRRGPGARNSRAESGGDDGAGPVCNTGGDNGGDGGDNGGDGGD